MCKCQKRPTLEATENYYRGKPYLEVRFLSLCERQLADRHHPVALELGAAGAVGDQSNARDSFREIRKSQCTSVKRDLHRGLIRGTSDMA
jgi:hypothetical protein